jgi:hypothetical protein
MNPENYEIAKNMFIEGYQTYEENEEIEEYTHRVIIPYFELFARDLENLVNIIKNKDDSTLQIIDYLEVIFNSKLYDFYLFINNENNLLKSPNNYSHYLIILIEFIKYKQYQYISKTLESLEPIEPIEPIESSQIPNDKNFIQYLLTKATIEKSQNCLYKMKLIYTELLNNFSSNINSINACNKLLNANNINFE